MPTGSYMAATMLGESQGRPQNNVLYYEQTGDNTGGDPGSLDCRWLAEGLRANSAYWAGMFPAGYTYLGTYVRQATLPPVTLYPYLAQTSSPGTRTGESFQAGFGALMLRGPAVLDDDRSQIGRTYFGAISEDDVTAGELTSSLITTIEDTFTTYLKSITQNGATYELGTFSKQNELVAGTFFWQSDIFRVQRKVAQVSRRKP